ncbi:MAG: hypothetical protein JW697_04000 [Kosmotogaceae bacterium]|nr:hypothetical protein [Kosmotogaceae bacterium]
MLEIERKFLFKTKISEEVIEEATRHLLIVQWYLNLPDRSRIRLIVNESDIYAVHTLKSGMGLIREEIEEVVDLSEILNMREELRVSKAVIKSRHVYKGNGIEGVIDWYLLPSIGYVLEVETSDPKVVLPDPWNFWPLSSNSFEEVTENLSYTARSISVAINNVAGIIPERIESISDHQISEFRRLLHLIYGDSGGINS